LAQLPAVLKILDEDQPDADPVQPKIELDKDAYQRLVEDGKLSGDLVSFPHHSWTINTE